MSRVVIIANTYSQMILAMQMNFTVFKDSSIVLLLSDHSKNTDVISERLNNENVFEKVCYFHSKGLVAGRTKADKLKDFKDITFKKTNRYSSYIEGIDDLRFDELICFNYNIDIIGLYSILSDVNSDIKVSLYEEGVLSYWVYFDDNYRRKLIRSFRHLRGKKDISEAFSKFYCYYPELYKGDLETVKIPSVAPGSECSKLLKKIFLLEDDKLAYNEKYIFFTSVYDFEGGEPIGEYELVMKVAELVGKDNLVIKTHPRDERDVFEKSGIRVDKNASIPWEAIQLSKDFSDKVFLTATSGSVLAGSFMAEKPSRTFYMYKLCDISENQSAQKSAKDIEALVNNADMKNVLRTVSIAEKIEDILT